MRAGETQISERWSKTSEHLSYFFLFSSPALTNVTISGNNSSDSGGGMYHTSSSPTLTNVTVSADVATDLDGNPRIVDGTVDMGAYE